MKTYYNFLLNKKGIGVRDLSRFYKIKDGILISYRGKPKGFLNSGYKYTRDYSIAISASTVIEDKHTMFNNGSGHVIIEFKGFGKFQFSIFENVEGFVEDIKYYISQA